MAAVKPDYIVLGPSDLEPTPETTPEDAERFVSVVEELTGVLVRNVGEIATAGPGYAADSSGPVVWRDGIYRFLPGEDEAWPGEDYADLPADWYERAWAMV